MAPSVSHLFSFFLSSLLLLLPFPFLSQATSSGPSGVGPSGLLKSSGSFKHLEGSRKGDKREGIQKVKQYLERYGYLNSVDSPQYSDSDDFDDILESSLKAFQKFYHLTPTGILDDPTATLMSRPRCGFPDHPPNYNSNNIIHPDYVLWDAIKWPADQMHIHYVVFPDGHKEEPITRGFDAWAAVSNFTFERVRDESFAQIRIYFPVMDGPNGLLGNAIAVLNNATINLDREECWAEGAVPDCYDMQTLATHEIGHILGLYHSELLIATMYAYTGTNETKPLTQDDIDGIRAKYST